MARPQTRADRRGGALPGLGSVRPCRRIFFAPIGHGGPSYIWMFVFYRVVGGIGVGLASMLSPMYIAEIAPARLRGNSLREPTRDHLRHDGGLLRQLRHLRYGGGDAC